MVIFFKTTVISDKPFLEKVYSVKLLVKLGILFKYGSINTYKYHLINQ